MKLQLKPFLLNFSITFFVCTSIINTVPIPVEYDVVPVAVFDLQGDSLISSTKYRNVEKKIFSFEEHD